MQNKDVQSDRMCVLSSGRDAAEMNANVMQLAISRNNQLYYHMNITNFTFSEVIRIILSKKNQLHLIPLLVITPI